MRAILLELPLLSNHEIDLMPDTTSQMRRVPSQQQNNNPNVAIVQDVAERIAHSVSQVIVGKRNEIRLTVLGLLSQGHILIEDIPGVGKTMMAKALARSIGAAFSRIQFTPDMLPSDVTGVSLFNQKTREFEFRPGPPFFFKQNTAYEMNSGFWSFVVIASINIQI